MTRRAKPGVVPVLIVCVCLLSTEEPQPVKQIGTSEVRLTSSLRRRIRFSDVTRKAGIEVRRIRSWGSAWADYDRDGDADFFLGRHGYAPRLYRNKGDGTFRRLYLRNIFYPYRVDRHGCAWGEANGDGRPDLYCTQGAQQGHGRGPNQLFIQRGDSFVDRASLYGVRDQFGRGRTAHWIDFDRDGDLDLFVGNELRRGYPNVMFRNTRSGFQRASVGLSRELTTTGSSWTDWDRDGDPDLLVMQNKDSSSANALAFENVRGHFRSVALPPITGNRWKSGAWGDYNGDGWPDLHLVYRWGSLILRNDRGRFRVSHRMALSHGRMSAWLDVENDGDLDAFVVQGAAVHGPLHGHNRPDFMIVRRRGRWQVLRRWFLRGPRSGNGDAVSTADFNRDGRVDVLVTNGYGPRQWFGRTELLKNRSRAAGWVGLRLRGGRRNPFGLGARIHIASARMRYWRQVTDGFNFRSQSEPGYVHLGIGRSRRVRVRVEWPGGGRDCITVRRNSIVSLTRRSHRCG